MITRINELKALAKHISCEYKCKFYGRKCNSDQWRNNNKCRCECKKRHVVEKDYVWNSATCSCENEKYLSSIMIQWIDILFSILAVLYLMHKYVAIHSAAY